GACCAPDGTCEVATAAGCAFSGGVFQGDGTNCDPNPCPQPMGACCFDDGSCTVDEGVVCVDAGGVFQGDGTTCATVTCPQPGACCLPDGACTQSMVLGGADCAGAYQGDDTTCAMVTCPQPGACCLPDGSCVLSAVVGGGDCEGAYQGDGTECETVECPTPSGFVGASLELVEDDGPGGNWTWRVYADFKGIDDVLLAVGAVPPTGELLFQSDAPLVNDGGVLAGTKDEDFPAEGFSGPRDSWVAIGDDLSFPSPTDYTPDFAGSDGKASVILGTAFSETNGGWFNNVPSTPVQGTHLLIAQFTLPSGSSFSLSGLVFWQNVPSFAVWTPEGEDFIASFFEVSIDPVATGACCLLDGSCSVDSPAACEFFAGTYQGDGTDCDAVECPQPMGACCFDDGSCTIETEDGCLAAGGISAGIGVLCEFGVCPQPGACCFEDGSCTLATGVGGADCVGVYQGDDTRCETAECPQPGACCLPDGSCVQAGVLGGADCEGVYQGDDTVCETVSCPQPGACCLDDGSCVQSAVLGGGDCAGVYQGDDTVCETVSCPQPGACCFPDGSCEQSSVIGGADCAGVYQGDDTDCGTAGVCPQPGACCFDDGSCAQSTVVGGSDCAGVYQGDDTTCATVQCPQPGACCLPDGSCVQSSVTGGADCAGAYQGDSTLCATVECPQPSGFLGASLELVEDDGPGGDWTWRVFIDFEGPTDVLLAVGSIADAVELRFDSDTPLINDGGVLAGTKAEDFPSGDFAGPRDSWVTIGDDLGFPSPTDYSPGFAGSDGKASVILGTTFSANDGGWFNNVPTTPVQGVHILVAQFTVASGSNFSLYGLAFWQPDPTFTLWDPEGEDFNTSFFEVSIEPPVTGACCTLDGMTCTVETAASCSFLGGIYRGDGTGCDAVECIPSGACCLPDGACVVESVEDCLAAGGVPQGIGLPCADAQCPQPGACCLLDGSCEIVPEVGGADCAGVYLGDNTTCDDGMCPAACVPSPDGDTDGDGFTDFNDLLNVLARWGLCMLPPGFECLGDVDCDGQVDFSDLKVVLAKWNPPGG
ncbi:MAG: hypothetical protein KJO43_08355, partial [Phycisphaerae bacterium]|nr:hypothetical protein [Phycisphaerae bacterium]